MIDPHKEYTLLEAAKAVLAHVEDETAWRHGSQCTLCFSYRKVLRDAIERAQLDPLYRPDPIAPPKWEVGMKVRYRNDADWAWSKGAYGVINEIRKDYIGLPGNEYQVFYTHPMRGDKVYKDASYWTTPADVDWVP